MSDLNAYKGDIVWRKGQEEAEKKFHSFIVETFTEPRKSTIGKKTITWVWPLAILALMILLATLLSGCAGECLASEVTASYYTVASCTKEGTGSGIGLMANGERLQDYGR
jgi:hypothetical protein